MEAYDNSHGNHAHIHRKSQIAEECPLIGAVVSRIAIRIIEEERTEERRDAENGGIGCTTAVTIARHVSYIGGKAATLCLVAKLICEEYGGFRGFGGTKAMLIIWGKHAILKRRMLICGGNKSRNSRRDINWSGMY